LIVGLFAVAIPSICVMLIGALNGWHLTHGLLVFYGIFICAIILTGEHVRSRVYERFVKVVEPSTGATGADSIASQVETIAAESQRGRLARPMSLTQRWLKRAFDVLLASLALIILFPLLIVTAIVVKFESPGPIIFRQLRIGFDGRPFSILKFRTMSVDRTLTRVGRYLRMTSIDELPQLVNVLIGDMSIVGPRPYPMAHDSEFQRALHDYAFRRHMKPGLTGWAQVHGLRGEMSTAEERVERRLEYDLWYIENWSLRLDTIILLKTVAEVLRHRDAY
jgi:putative colanic acid biosynthesis UDP-glucose lipid carrier transferase